MNQAEIALIRLVNQQLASTGFTKPQEIVSWMGAMQAQDFPMAKWAIGTRLAGTTDSLIEAAIDRGDILRTHVMRPTWHFVTAGDIYWLLELTAAQVKAAQSSRNRQLKLSEGVFTKSNSIIEKALGKAGALSREELLAELRMAGIATDQNRSAHLLARAELDKIICSGPIRNGKPTYALLAERVPKKVSLTREEAFAAIARRYINSRGPATLQDFSWWSGMSSAWAKHALGLVIKDFHQETIDGRTYYFSEHFMNRQPVGEQVHLLPTYDEFLVAYKDRSASINAMYADHMDEISNRGMFWPVIIINGQVQGIWKRIINKSLNLITIKPFIQFSLQTKSLIAEAVAMYGKFTGKTVEIMPYDLSSIQLLEK